MVDYEDMNEIPRGGIPTRLPGPRTISTTVMNRNLAPAGSLEDKKLSGLHFAFGQFVTHEMIETETIPFNRRPNYKCCNLTDNNFNNTDLCFPFDVPENDTVLTPPCESFIRAVAAENRGSYREQKNRRTSYVDGSNVYGSSDKEAQKLRVKGSYLMKTARGEVLPEGRTRCRPRNPELHCQAAGDSRVNQVPHLGILHSLFVREHNRIAKELRLLRLDWNNETVFQETRKIVNAEIQQITYCEYLPAILSPKILDKYGLTCKKCGYSDHYMDLVDASVRNGFAVAAFRFGHSQAMAEQSLLDEDYKIVKTEDLRDNFFDPFLPQAKHGKFLEDMGRWLTYFPADKVDQFGVDPMQNHLFGNQSDLFAINIQRGRDQGCPGYNEWREFCGLTKKTFADFGENSEALQGLYRSVDDIDLFLAGLLEPPAEGGSVGETFACIIAKQFQITKFGDRYWYEREDANLGFTEDQLNSIKRMTMAKLMCQNLNIAEIQLKAFENPYGRETLQACSTLPDLDFTAWKEDASSPVTGQAAVECVTEDGSQEDDDIATYLSLDNN